jgi:hypothetical protein
MGTQFQRENHLRNVGILCVVMEQEQYFYADKSLAINANYIVVNCFDHRSMKFYF